MIVCLRTKLLCQNNFDFDHFIPDHYKRDGGAWLGRHADLYAKFDGIGLVSIISFTEAILNHPEADSCPLFWNLKFFAKIKDPVRTLRARISLDNERAGVKPLVSCT